jgi:hypothetical protein
MSIQSLACSVGRDNHPVRPCWLTLSTPTRDDLEFIQGSEPCDWFEAGPRPSRSMLANLVGREGGVGGGIYFVERPMSAIRPRGLQSPV